ncbi:hypothetical protein Q4508_08085 [Amphritea sp. 2_MG-2023]|uniref:hypothetical protein n=1 Tax=Amphritea TaxID=515417 RepID=UPI001C072DE9|nr:MULTISPECIES: hypothetical protein [Amphritea]MBU2964114.1 hypothetical protein [Amphritea atlantica]MDO6418512.1 hypothetical protein [Amphritea sp. 2_MG-2023]
MSEPAIEDALYETASMQLLSGLPLDKPIDHSNVSPPFWRSYLDQKDVSGIDNRLTEAGY